MYLRDSCFTSYYQGQTNTVIHTSIKCQNSNILKGAVPPSLTAWKLKSAISFYLQNCFGNLSLVFSGSFTLDSVTFYQIFVCTDQTMACASTMLLMWAASQHQVSRILFEWQDITEACTRMLPQWNCWTLLDDFVGPNGKMASQSNQVPSWDNTPKNVWKELLHFTSCGLPGHFEAFWHRCFMFGLLVFKKPLEKLMTSDWGSNEREKVVNTDHNFPLPGNNFLSFLACVLMCCCWFDISKSKWSVAMHGVPCMVLFWTRGVKASSAGLEKETIWWIKSMWGDSECFSKLLLAVSFALETVLLLKDFNPLLFCLAFSSKKLKIMQNFRSSSLTHCEIKPLVLHFLHFGTRYYKCCILSGNKHLHQYTCVLCCTSIEHLFWISLSHQMQRLLSLPSNFIIPWAIQNIFVVIES